MKSGLFEPPEEKEGKEKVGRMFRYEENKVGILGGFVKFRVVKGRYTRGGCKNLE